MIAEGRRAPCARHRPLTWDDGTAEAHEGDLGLAFHSRGYRFWFDGQHSGGLEVEGPVPPEHALE